MRYLTIICCIAIIFSCKEKEKPLTAQDIVDKAIYNACHGNCEQARFDFTFRDVKYVSERNNEKYQLERIVSDSSGITRDVLNNEGFNRYLNDAMVKVADSMSDKYSNSVNSVHYFVQLPFGLNAPAVKKELIGEAVIKGKKYYEIAVHFSEEGGGTDFEDAFMYWIQKETYTVDYLAYQYATNGGGIRFREAYNPRVVNGIRFVDYNNFKPSSLEVSLTDLDELFEADKLELLSKIETKDVEVTLLSD